MNRIFLLLLLGVSLFASACGRKPVYDVASDFAPYVQRFQDVARAQGHPVEVQDIKIQFGPMETALEEGACEIGDNITPTVTIRKDNWDSLPDDQKEQLIFHELGHCVLYKRHNSAVDANGNPSSIMNPYVIAEGTYDQNHDHYMAELFN